MQLGQPGGLVQVEDARHGLLRPTAACMPYRNTRQHTPHLLETFVKLAFASCTKLQQINPQCAECRSDSLRQVVSLTRNHATTKN